MVMLQLEVILSAVILMTVGFTALMLCLCVDFISIIKSRGSTLLSRDSTTEKEAKRLKKSLERVGLISKNTNSKMSKDHVENAADKNGKSAESISLHPIPKKCPSSLLVGEVSDDHGNPFFFKESKSFPEKGRKGFATSSGDLSVSVSVHHEHSASDSQLSSTSSSINFDENSGKLHGNKQIITSRDSCSVSSKNVIISTAEIKSKKTASSFTPKQENFTKVLSTQNNEAQDQNCVASHESSITKCSFSFPSHAKPNGTSEAELKSSACQYCYLEEIKRKNVGQKSFDPKIKLNCSEPVMASFDSRSRKNFKTHRHHHHPQATLHKNPNLSYTYSQRSTPIFPSCLHGSGNRQRISPLSSSSSPSPTSLSSSSHSGGRAHRSKLEDIKEDTSCSEQEEMDVGSRRTICSVSAPADNLSRDAKQSLPPCTMLSSQLRAYDETGQHLATTGLEENERIEEKFKFTRKPS